MTMSHADVQAWLDRYVEAWKTYDPASVAALFAENAEYRYHPWDEPVSGRDQIVENWVNPGEGPASGRDEPGTWWARYEPYAVEGNKAVVTGETKYFEDATQATLLRHYWNIWTIEFDAGGKCTSFVEYFMQQKKPAPTAAQG
jgi:SnoaL-like domain